MSDVDVLVIGGGISGAAIGWALAADRSVALLEQEQSLGVHTTGRSAATLVETLGSNEIRALTIAGRAFLEHPPDEFGPSPLRPMSLLYMAEPEQVAALHELHDEVRADVPDVRLLGPAETETACGYLRPGVAAAGLLEPRAMEVDVAALHQSYVRGLRERGGQVLRGHGLAHAAYDGSGWTITDATGEQHRAGLLVNAAGAWCDEVAEQCGVRPIGIRPLRRTIFTIPGGTGVRAPAGAPLLIDVGERFYVRPETGQFLCSPMDETPMPPCDPRPEQLDIARAMEVIDRCTLLAPRSVRTSWAGLRSFAPDRLPVVGFAPDQPAFLWYAGQGGFGVQTSPGLARAGAAIVTTGDLPADLLDAGLTVARLSPQRLDQSRTSSSPD